VETVDESTTSNASESTTSSKRDHSVLVRLTAEERDQLNARAKQQNITAADYIRQRLDAEPTSRGSAGGSRYKQRKNKAPAELVAQVARIGNNLNQIARRVNVGDTDVMSALVSIDRATRDLVDAYTPGKGKEG